MGFTAAMDGSPHNSADTNFGEGHHANQVEYGLAQINPDRPDVHVFSFFAVVFCFPHRRKLQASTRQTIPLQVLPFAGVPVNTSGSGVQFGVGQVAGRTPGLTLWPRSV
jgi:hypothetical protein